MPRAASLLAFVAWSLDAAVARGVVDFPKDVRQRNVVRVSELACDDCVTLDTLYKTNNLVFLLFYERALVGKHHYKASIIDGFHAACAELRWSHVVCGAVDMVDDKAYAQRYIDPKTAPAHIVVRGGQPVAIQKRHLERLMAKPGDKETILWHLRDLLTSDRSPNALDISLEVGGAEAFARALRSYRVVIAGAVDRDDEESRDAFRAAAQRLVFSGEVPMKVEPPSSSSAKKGKGALHAQKDIGFVLALGSKALAGSNLTKGAAAAFVGGKRQTEEVQLGTKKPSEAAMLEALRSVALLVLQAGAAPAVGEGGGKKRKRKGKGATREL